MIRKAVFTLLVSVLFSAQAYSQDLTNLSPQFMGGFEAETRQARVGALPTNFFADEDRSFQSPASDQSATAAQNMVVLFSLGSLLLVGSAITGFCVIRRRNSNQVSVAPPVKLYV